MLRVRLAAATAILIPVLAVVWADYAIGPMGAWLFPLGLLICLAGADEVLTLVRKAGLPPDRGAVLTGVAVVYLIACAPMAWDWFGREYPRDCHLGRLGWSLSAIAAGIGVVALAEMRRFREPGQAIRGAAAGVFVVAYLSLLAAFLAPLRTFAGENDLGLAALVSMIFVSKMSDAGAYLVGRMLGRTPLAPRVSPAKTVEGGVGGLAAGCAASWWFFAWLAPRAFGIEAPASAPAWIGYGLVVSLAGAAGDLFESLLKRDAGAKNSSGWLPGLGGVMDVMDSVLTAAPAAFAYWASILM